MAPSLPRPQRARALPGGAAGETNGRARVPRCPQRLAGEPQVELGPVEFVVRVSRGRRPSLATEFMRVDAGAAAARTS